MSAATSSTLKIKDNKTLNSGSEKLLGLTIDSKHSFNNYLDKIIKKDNQKVHVLTKITPCVSIPKRKLLINFLFTHHNLIGAPSSGCVLIV